MICLSRTVDQHIQHKYIKGQENNREKNGAEKGSLVEGSNAFESGFHESVF
jgi:hypothetical protein